MTRKRAHSMSRRRFARTADVCSGSTGGGDDQDGPTKTQPERAGELLGGASEPTPIEVRLADLLMHGVMQRVPASRLARMSEDRRFDLVLSWARELRTWQARVGVPWTVVRATLQYVHQHESWGGLVLGPDSLLQQWDAIRSGMAVP